MVETHFDPDNAWSDAQQQITPATLVQVMKDLRIRKEVSESEEFQTKLKSLRAMIDIADTQLLDVLSRRMKIADEIGKAKKEQNVAILQNQRWSQILDKMTAEGEQNGLSEEFIMRIFKAIHQESINHQEEVMKKS